MRCDDIFIALEDSDQYESFRDLGLYCTRWDFPPAQPRVSTIPVTGGDGVFDVSESVRGDVGFDNVAGMLSLVAFRSGLAAESSPAGAYNHSAFCQKYHGKRVKIKASFDPDHYRVGRMWISEDGQQAVLRNFTITMDAEPFRYAVQEKTVIITAAGTESTPTATIVSKHPQWLSVSTSAGRFYSNDTFSDNSFRPYYVVSIPISAGKTYSLTYDKEAYYDCSFTESFYLDADLTHEVESTFNSGAATKLYIKCYLLTYKTNTTTVFGMRNIRLIESAAHDIVNEGRKIIIPTVTATANSTLFAAGRKLELTAGDTVLAWDFPLYYGSNLCSTIGSGNVTIKFREGLL